MSQSGSKTSTNTSGDKRAGSNDSTIAEVVINVDVEESKPADTSIKIEDSDVSDEDSFLSQVVKSIQSVKSQKSKSSKTPAKFTSSRIEFNKGEMLMIHSPHESTRLSLSTIEATGTEGQPRLDETNPPENSSLTKSPSDSNQHKSDVTPIEAKEQSSSSELENQITVKRTQTKILFGPNASTTKRPILHKQSSSRSQSQSHLIESSSTPLLENVPSVSDEQEQPSSEIDGGTAENISETQTYNENSGENSHTDSEGGAEELTNQSEQNETSKQEELSCLSQSKMDTQTALKILNGDLDELERQCKALRRQKCRAMGSQTNSSRLDEDEYEVDIFGTVHRKRFPYYPYGIIHPKCHCIKGKGKSSKSTKSLKKVPWIN